MNSFKQYSPGQLLLMPPSLDDWLEDGHLVYSIRDVVQELDLSEVYDDYDASRGGQPAYDPQMMVGLVIYAYCVGLPSSRKIERATYESVPWRNRRFLTGAGGQPASRSRHHLRPAVIRLSSLT